MTPKRANVVFIWYNPETGAEVLRRESHFRFPSLVTLGIHLVSNFKTFPVFPDRVEISFKAE